MGTVRLPGGVLAALLALVLTGMGTNVWAAESTAEPIALKAATGIDNTVEPLIRGWERFFTISWDSWERSGQAVVGGYIVNQMGSRATRVQLLVEGLDASGRAVDHRVTWLGSELPPWTRTYYEVRAPQGGVTYRVSVFAFDWMQAASVQAP